VTMTNSASLQKITWTQGEVEFRRDPGIGASGILDLVAIVEGAVSNDLVKYDGSDWVRVPVGAAGQFVGYDGTNILWDTPMGSGDMLKSVYDTDSDNVVDNSEALGGVGSAAILSTQSQHTASIAALVADDTAISNIAASALQNVVEDTTPQLGGNLSGNGNSITGASVVVIGGATSPGAFTVLGDMATIGAGAGTQGEGAGDLYVANEFEVDGPAYLDGGFQTAGGKTDADMNDWTNGVTGWRDGIYLGSNGVYLVDPTGLTNGWLTW